MVTRRNVISLLVLGFFIFCSQQQWDFLVLCYKEKKKNQQKPQNHTLVSLSSSTVPPSLETLTTLDFVYTGKRGAVMKYVPSTQPETRAPRASSPFLEVCHPGPRDSTAEGCPSSLQWLWHQGCGEASARALLPLTGELHFRWGSGPCLCWSYSCVEALSLSLWPGPADQLPGQTSDLPHCWGLACCWWDCICPWLPSPDLSH